jgi:hypothetical protein
MKPVDVSRENESALWTMQYEPYRKKKNKEQDPRFKFAVGDTVRISHLRSTFMREYEEKWTQEIFIVVKRYGREGLPIYKLMDYLNETVQGTFYEPELQAVKEPETYKIETILKTKKVKGKKQHLVKWVGWASKYDSWIDGDALETYK